MFKSIFNSLENTEFTISQRSNSFILAALTFFIPLIYSRQLADGTDLPRFFAILMLGLFSLLLFFITQPRPIQISFHRLLVIPFGILVWSTISISWSLDPSNSYIKLFELLSSFIILYLATQTNPHQQKQIINIALISCMIVILIGILQLYGINPFNIHYNDDIPASTFINQNHASIYIEFFIPVALIFLLFSKIQAVKIYLLIFLVLAIPYLIVLSSFGTLIALSTSLTIIFIVLHRRFTLKHILSQNIKYIVILLVSTTLLSTHFHSVSKNISTRTVSFEKSVQKSSHRARLALYIKTLSAITDNPVIGFGYGAFRAGIIPYIADVQNITYHDEKRYYKETHNDYLQQAAETGLIAGLFFLFFFILIAFKGLYFHKNESDNRNSIITLAISSGLLTLILHAFIDFPFHLAASNLLIYLSAGFILSNQSRLISLTNKLIKPLSALMIIPFLIFSGKEYIYHIYSSKLVRDSAIAYFKNDDCESAVKAIDKSYELYRHNFQSQATRAFIYRKCYTITKNSIENVIKELIYQNKTNLHAHYVLGNVYLNQRKMKKSFFEFQYHVEMLPNSPSGYIGLGKWALTLNKHKDAKIYLQKALKLDPDNLWIKDTLIKINAY